jgi:hypothetical protein
MSYFDVLGRASRCGTGLRGVRFERRNQQLNQRRQTLSAWRASDLNAARAAFEAADLSNKERESLEKKTQ